MKRSIIALLTLAALLLGGCTAADDHINNEDSDKASYNQISQDEARQMMASDDGHVVIDVRRQDEYDEGHIPGAVCIPNESISGSMPEELPDLDQIILVYCRTGRRSKEASQKLSDIGYTNVYEFGGITEWTGDITPAAGTDPVAAELSFDSFCGGGPEFTVYIDDESIVSYRREVRSSESDDSGESVDGYTVIYSFTGLKPGETEMLIEERSRAAENRDRKYIIRVDQDLNVYIEETSIVDVSKEEEEMKLYIEDLEVPVVWEDNESVRELHKICPLTIQMSMYGGFEQVGPIGESIYKEDEQLSAEYGDIMLYSGNQIVVFYGSNNWAYTKLGHVELSREELTELLGNGDVKITVE